MSLMPATYCELPCICHDKLALSLKRLKVFLRAVHEIRPPVFQVYSVCPRQSYRRGKQLVGGAEVWGHRYGVEGIGREVWGRRRACDPERQRRCRGMGSEACLPPLGCLAEHHRFIAVDNDAMLAMPFDCTPKGCTLRITTYLHQFLNVKIVIDSLNRLLNDRTFV